MDCPPGHVPYASPALAANAVLLHLLAYPACPRYKPWACGDHWHVGHPTRGAGEVCKRNPAARSRRARIERLRKRGWV